MTQNDRSEKSLPLSWLQFRTKLSVVLYWVSVQLQQIYWPCINLHEVVFQICQIHFLVGLHTVAVHKADVIQQILLLLLFACLFLLFYSLIAALKASPSKLISSLPDLPFASSLRRAIVYHTRRVELREASEFNVTFKTVTLPRRSTSFSVRVFSTSLTISFFFSILSLRTSFWSKKLTAPASMPCVFFKLLQGV